MTIFFKINDILNHLINNTTIEFIYAPKYGVKFNKKKYIKHPFYGYYNKFFLKKKNNKLSFISERGIKKQTKTPMKDALNLFQKYYNNPDFSTMIALTDENDNNLIFYNTDTEQYYNNELYDGKVATDTMMQELQNEREATETRRMRRLENELRSLGRVRRRQLLQILLREETLRESRELARALRIEEHSRLSQPDEGGSRKSPKKRLNKKK